MARLKRSGEVQVDTAATPEQVWSLLADIGRAGDWSHETTGGDWLDGATSAAPGARFKGRNRNGRLRWARTCEIVTAEPPGELSWRTVPTALYPDSTLWRYRIEPVAGGSRITQSFEVLKLSPLLERLFAMVIPAHQDRTAKLIEDLQHLGEVAASRAPQVGRPDAAPAP